MFNWWIWHSNFGYPGTLNNISVWDRSTLLQLFVNGKWKTDGLDFRFTIGNSTFTELSFLVGGIYPNLACFVKVVASPVMCEENVFSEWQGSSRNDA